jgi:hypothetical protein
MHEFLHSSAFLFLTSVNKNSRRLKVCRGCFLEIADISYIYKKRGQCRRGAGKTAGARLGLSLIMREMSALRVVCCLRLRLSINICSGALNWYLQSIRGLIPKNARPPDPVGGSRASTT